MNKRTGLVANILVSGAVCAGSAAAQTSKNPISTKPEGTAPTCSYTGSATDGKTTQASTCPPGVVTGTAPGADPNQSVPANASQRFPFPGSSSDAPAPAAPSVPQNGIQPASPSAPSSVQGPPPGSSASQRFPFPGEDTPGDAPNTPSTGKGTSSGQPPLQDAGSSGSSGSSSSSSGNSGYSSSGGSDPGGGLPDDDPNAPLPTPRHTARKKLPAVTKPVTPDEQEAEDVQVAGFYQNDGNYKAAYERAKEAVGLMADDPDAHLALAEAARKLGKLDEAETNYKKTLSLDPVPKTRKLAERALKEMAGS